jgi:hypothetical protein
MKFYLILTEIGLSARYKRARQSKVRFGTILQLNFHLTKFLPVSVIPSLGIYLNIDPTPHIAQQLFKAVPMFPYLLDLISVYLIPVGLMAIRIVIIVVFVNEILRILNLALILILMFTAQFQDVLDFQIESFNNSKRNIRQSGLKHVLKYRESILLRDSFTPALYFAALISLVIAIPSIVEFNFCQIKMHSGLPIPISFMLVYFLLIVMFLIKSVLDQGTSIQDASLKLLNSFKVETERLRGRERRYVLKALKSLPVCFIYAELPGYNFFPAGSSTTTAVFRLIADHTADLLLAFRHNIV